jgi:hypothetical protein
MKLRVFWIVAAIFVMTYCASANTEERTYRQFKDVVVRENGSVGQSGDKNDLFECNYSVDLKRNTITRTSIRRLDRASAEADATVYTIHDKRRIVGSESGNGGDVLIAVSKDGNEILEIGRKFAFTTRMSSFSQVITGVYKRVYGWEGHHDKKPHPHK